MIKVIRRIVGNKKMLEVKEKKWQLTQRYFGFVSLKTITEDKKKRNLLFLNLSLK